MCAFSYAWSLPVTWQRWRSHHLIGRIKKTHATCKRHRTYVLYNRYYCRSKFYIVGIGISTFLLLWPWPWPDDFHIRTGLVFPGSAKVQRWEHPTSKLSKVIVWQIDRYYQNCIPPCFAGGKKWKVFTAFMPCDYSLSDVLHSNRFDVRHAMDCTGDTGWKKCKRDICSWNAGGRCV